MVKCFSITLAPKETAEIDASMPGVWSEYPTLRPKTSLKFFMASKLLSL